MCAEIKNEEKENEASYENCGNAERSRSRRVLYVNGGTEKMVFGNWHPTKNNFKKNNKEDKMREFGS